MKPLIEQVKVREEEIQALLDANKRHTDNVKKMSDMLRIPKLCDIYHKTLRKNLGEERVK